MGTQLLASMIIIIDGVGLTIKILLSLPVTRYRRRPHALLGDPCKTVRPMLWDSDVIVQSPVVGVACHTVDCVVSVGASLRQAVG